MRRLLLLVGIVMAITLSGTAAGALPDCYYARVPVPDGGEPAVFVVCPMP